MLSVVTYGELLYGAAKSEQRVAALARLRELVHFLPAMSLPETAAEAYGTIRAQLESKGETIGNNDLWIAACNRGRADVGYKQRRRIPPGAGAEDSELGGLASSRSIRSGQALTPTSS